MWKEEGTLIIGDDTYEIEHSKRDGKWELKNSEGVVVCNASKPSAWRSKVFINEISDDETLVVTKLLKSRGNKVLTFDLFEIPTGSSEEDGEAEIETEPQIVFEAPWFGLRAKIEKSGGELSKVLLSFSFAMFVIFIRRRSQGAGAGAGKFLHSFNFRRN